MNIHQCVEEYRPSRMLERAGRLATVVAGLAITAYAVYERNIEAGAVGLGIAIPSGVNAVVSEL